jgi:hypothetical protein
MTRIPGARVEIPVTIFDATSRLSGHLRFTQLKVQDDRPFLSAGLLFEVDEPLRMELTLPGLPEGLPLVGRVVSVHREADGAMQSGMDIEVTWLADDDRRRLEAFLVRQWSRESGRLITEEKS